MVTKINIKPKKIIQISGEIIVKYDFNTLTTIAPIIAPYKKPLPPNATQTTISIDFIGENSPGFIIPTWGTYKAPAIPANTADKVKIIILNMVVLYPKNLILVSLSLMPTKIFPILELTINRQIRDIEKLVNEFSNFARMPRPIFKKLNIVELIKSSLEFIKISSKNTINLISKNQGTFINGDEDQLNRVFINLIKNSEEAFEEMIKKDHSFKGNIDIEISSNNDYIFCRIIDNGPGITDSKKAMTPYFTTKKTGTGLGLPIVTKIINEHNGIFSIKSNKKKGTLISISLPKINA